MNLLSLNTKSTKKLSGVQKMGRFRGRGTARTIAATIAIAIVPHPHYCRRTRQACAGEMVCTFSKPHSRPPSSAPLYGVHRSSPSEKFPLFSRHPYLPPSSSPPFCPLAFSRRQILKSIEFPVGQTAKLPPNNPMGLVFQHSAAST